MITVDFYEKIFSGNLVSTHSRLEEIHIWCEYQFGPIEPGGLWDYHGLGRFAFRNQDDAVLFTLRWS
jgi:hypothetical protein